MEISYGNEINEFVKSSSHTHYKFMKNLVKNSNNNNNRQNPPVTGTVAPAAGSYQLRLRGVCVAIKCFQHFKYIPET